MVRVGLYTHEPQHTGGISRLEQSFLNCLPSLKSHRVYFTCSLSTVTTNFSYGNCSKIQTIRNQCILLNSSTFLNDPTILKTFFNSKVNLKLVTVLGT